MATNTIPRFYRVRRALFSRQRAGARGAGAPGRTKRSGLV
jgi:hypothetical protein